MDFGWFILNKISKYFLTPNDLSLGYCLGSDNMLLGLLKICKFESDLKTQNCILMDSFLYESYIPSVHLFLSELQIDLKKHKIHC